MSARAIIMCTRCRPSEFGRVFRTALDKVFVTKDELVRFRENDGNPIYQA